MNGISPALEANAPASSGRAGAWGPRGTIDLEAEASFLGGQSLHPVLELPDSPPDPPRRGESAKPGDLPAETGGLGDHLLFAVDESLPLHDCSYDRAVHAAQSRSRASASRS
jgi:hypothetical protein